MNTLPPNLNEWFAHPIPQAGVKRSYFATYTVTQPLESGLAHEFCVPCLDRLTDLSQCYLRMTMRLVQADGTAIPEPLPTGSRPDIAPINNALMSNYQHMELFAGSELLTQVSNFHLQQFMLTVLNTNKDEKASILREQGFILDDLPLKADKKDGTAFKALRERFTASAPVTMIGRIRG